MKSLKISDKVKLEINEENTHKDFIPASHPFEDDGLLVEQVGIAIQENIPLLLIGETGTGKTSVVRYFANKTNNGFRRVNHNGGTTVEDIIGRTLIDKAGTYWVDGVLTQALRLGLWYLADEINASTPEINFIYHSLLDDDGYIVLPENNGEIVHAHPNFRFFAAQNPVSDYSGTKELNKALLSRFLVVKTGFPQPEVEQKILVDRTGISKTDANRMINFATSIRSAKKNQFQTIISTRELLLWAKMYSIYGKFIPAAEISILNKVDPEDYEAVKDMISLKFKALDNPAEKKATA